MKFLVLILFVFSTSMAFANETTAVVEPVQETNKISAEFSEEEVGQALETTEKTLNRIGRDIAGEIEEEEL